MRVRVVAMSAVALALPLACATTVLAMSSAAGQTLHCGAGGAGGRGPNGGWGLSGADGGNGTMPNCGQNTNGDSTPRMNCWAGGDAGETPVKPPKTIGPRDPEQSSGVLEGVVGGAARVRSSRSGLELETPPSGQARARGGRTRIPENEFDGKPGDGGDGVMPTCQQNTNTDGLGMYDWAADTADPAAGVGSGAAETVGFAAAGAAAGSAARPLAHTGRMTELELPLAGLALVIGGLLIVAARMEKPRWATRPVGRHFATRR